MTLPVGSRLGRYQIVELLGTPTADKQHVVLEASPDVTTERTALVHDVLAWLDKYLGRVE